MRNWTLCRKPVEGMASARCLLRLQITSFFAAFSSWRLDDDFFLFCN